MKSFLKRFLLFLGFTAFVYFFLILISALVFKGSIIKNIKYKPGLYGYFKTRAKEAESVKNINILFFGSSHSYRGFDTRIFEKNGFSSFNFGSSSQTPIQTRLLIKRHIKRLDPDIVVIDVYPEIFKNDGVESAIDFISNDYIGFDTFRMAAAINNPLVYNSLIFGFFKQKLNFRKEVEDEPELKKDKYIPGGYVEKEVLFLKRVGKIFPHKKWEIKPNQKKAILEITEIIKKMGKTLVLVQVPVHENYYKSYLNIKDMDEFFSSLGNYYNFNEISKTWGDEFFYDKDHLNKNGVAVFNEKFIEILKRDNLLK